MAIGYWQVEDYVQSWAESFAVLMRSGQSTSCFVASLTDPEAANFVMTWPLYRRDDVVLIQNSIVFLDELEKPFSVKSPWESVGPHQVIDEDGQRISQWSCSVVDMAKFFA